MFYRIKNDTVYDYADHKYTDDCLDTDLCTESEYSEHPNKYIVADVEIEPSEEGEEPQTVKQLIINPDYEEEEAERREAEFNKAFFNTSLGYIRRSVTMADGSKKDFLSDLLLPIKAGLELGQTVEIITYSQPDFSEDVTDWTQYQTIKNATPEFIAECLQQTVRDFGLQNEE